MMVGSICSIPWSHELLTMMPIKVLYSLQCSPCSEDMFTVQTSLSEVISLWLQTYHEVMSRARIPVIGEVGQREWCWQFWEVFELKARKWKHSCHCINSSAGISTFFTDWPFHCLKYFNFHLNTRPHDWLHTSQTSLIREKRNICILGEALFFLNFIFWFVFVLVRDV